MISKKGKALKIVFMGTPEFAVASLKALHESSHEVVAVVTAPDRPAGRGRSMMTSAVKNYAVEHHLRLLQPEKLKDESFINALQRLGADLFVVVAFRMLPKVVWSIPPLGTVNVHASLLPRYRGAAPINHAIRNGETETGVTTFMINEEIDTGDILFQEKVMISSDETAGELHDRLMTSGAELIVATADRLAAGSWEKIPQSAMDVSGDVPEAPKIFTEDCFIPWSESGKTIHDFIRSLSPYPGARTRILVDDKEYVLKVYESFFQSATHHEAVMSLHPDKGLSVAVRDGWVQLKEVQMEGKKRMSAEQFMNGLRQPLKIIA
ncbi:MAG: methionyl-tRNA formyltransferase [Flavobacteriales bacterium]|nr:methionyl-tRNA formyltransferase [Flavobacteriales bacterium]